MTTAPIFPADFENIEHLHSQFCDRHNDSAITLQNETYILGRKRGVLDQAPKIEALKEALRVARACIHTDRVADCHMDPTTNTLDADGAQAVAEYDAILAKIDAAIASE